MLMQRHATEPIITFAACKSCDARALLDFSSLLPSTCLGWRNHHIEYGSTAILSVAKIFFGSAPPVPYCALEQRVLLKLEK